MSIDGYQSPVAEEGSIWKAAATSTRKSEKDARCVTGVSPLAKNIKCTHYFFPSKAALEFTKKVVRC